MTSWTVFAMELLWRAERTRDHAGASNLRSDNGLDLALAEVANVLGVSLFGMCRGPE
jgi:hypothetical protein